MATKWISPTWRMPEESNQSKFDNYSLNFDGTEFIDLEDNFDNVFTGDNWSVSAWIYATGNTSFDNFFNKGTTVQFYLFSNKIQIYLAPSGIGVWPLESTATLSLNTWYNIVFTRSGNENKLYINGTLDNSATSTGSISSSTGSLTIGSYNGGSSYFWEGKLTEYSIFDYALTDGTGGTENQIGDLYNSGTPVNPMALTPAPIAYYPLGGSSTGSASTLTTPNESVPSATVFDFDGSDDRISIPEFTFSGEFTLSMWVNPEAITSTNTFILGRWDNNFDNDIQVNNEGDGSTTIRLRIGGTTLTFYGYLTNPDGVIPLNTWSNIVLTRDSSNLITCYVDSIQFSTSTFTNTNTLTLDSIGRVINNSYGWEGLMSNIQFWDKGLSQVNVTTLYNNGVPYTGTQPQAANLKAWYKLNVNEIWEDLAQQWRVKNNGITTVNYDRAGQSNFSYGGGYFNYLTTTNLTQSRTISLWIKYDINRQTGTLRYGFFNNPSLQFFGTGFREINQASSGVVTFTVSGVNVSDGGWHHILLHTIGDSADASNIAYIDGQLATRSVIGTNSYTFGNPGVGYSSKSGNLPPAAYSFSNLVMYNGDATSNVNALYNNGTPPADVSSTTPDVWWKTNSTNSSVTTLEDFSGNNNDSTTTYTQPVNMVTDNWIAESGISSGMTTANLVNSDLTRSIPYSSYSMVFDGLTEDIRCGNSLGSSLSQAEYVTVSCWVYFNDITEEQGLWNFRSGDNTNDVGTSLSLYSSGTVLRLAYYEGGNNGYVTISNPGFSNENWYNITCVYDKGAAGKIYINGQAQTVVDSGVYSTVDFSSDNFYIGSYYSSTYSTNGNLSNIAVWNSELTSDQVLTVYNGGVPKDISNLSPTRWWSLAGDSYFDGNDFICPNLTSSSNDGTSYNLGSTDLVGNGPGSTANGIATSMNIPENLQGNAPNSSKNAFSVNMNSADRVEDVAPTP